MKRALVLGGGGVVGVAWETGLAHGFAAAGVALRELVDVVVGTSAGSLVGSQLLHGSLREPGEKKGSDTKLPIDFSKIDAQAMGTIFALWGKMEPADSAVAAKIGGLAAKQNREGEAGWVEHIGTSTGVREWPATALRVCAVDTQSGVRRVFDSSSGVQIARAMAASSAVPGIFPSVEIDGVLYMDGQVHSSTNADVLLDGSHAQPEHVLIAMPTNELNAKALGAHARAMVEREIETLQASGCKVDFRTPDEADAQKMGSNLMDPAGAPGAFDAGFATGKAWAEQL
jgi:NTE family protein